MIIPKKEWAFDPAEGSQFLDWGVHETDALRWLTGSEARPRLRRVPDLRHAATGRPVGAGPVHDGRTA